MASLNAYPNTTYYLPQSLQDELQASGLRANEKDRYFKSIQI